MDTVGLAVRAGSVDDHDVVALVDALADSLIEGGVDLVTRVVDDAAHEEQVYRYWARTGAVSGVALVHAEPDDPRVQVLGSLGFPFAAVTGSAKAAFPAVVVDAGQSAEVLRSFLAARGRGRTVFLLARPGQAGWSGAPGLDGPPQEVYVRITTESALATAAEAAAEGPVTVVFDNDVHAAAVLDDVLQRGLRVPEDVAIVSWTYSAVCQGATRSITALNRRGAEVGALLGLQLRGALAGGPIAPVLAPAPFVVLGESA